MTYSHLATNTMRVIKQPLLGVCYAKWVTSRLIQRTPKANFNNGIRFGGFTSFSEYWLRHAGLDSEDLDVIRIVHSTCPPSGSLAIDIGANLGLFSLSLSKIGFEKVYACEPIPTTHERLRSNLNLNPTLSNRVIPCLFGIGEDNTLADFLISPTSPGQNKLLPPAAQTNSPTHQPIDTLPCRIMTLPSMFSEYQITRAHFIKMDVEGFESSILAGGLSLLRSGKVAFIYSEVIAEALSDAGSSLGQFQSLIEEAEFDPVIVRDSYNPTFEKVDFQTALSQAGIRRNMLFRSRHFTQS